MDSSKEMKTEVTKLNEMVGGSLGTIVSGTDEKTDKICANIEENTKLYSASKSEYDQTSERNNCESVEMNSKKVDINNEVVESDVQKGSNLSELCNKTHVSAENIQGKHIVISCLPFFASCQPHYIFFCNSRFQS